MSDIPVTSGGLDASNQLLNEQQQLQVRRVGSLHGDDGGVNASSPAPSGYLGIDPQSRIWIALPSGLLSAVQRLMKALLPSTEPSTGSLDHLMKKRTFNAALKHNETSFCIYKQYLGPADFTNLEAVRANICRLPEDQSSAIIGLAKLANLTQLAVTIIPTLHDGSSVSEDTLLDLDTAFVGSFFEGIDLHRQQDDDKSLILDSFATYVKEIRTYSFIKSLETARAEHGPDERKSVDPDENLFGTFYSDEIESNEPWLSSYLKGWEFDEVGAGDGSGKYDLLPAEYQPEFEARINDLRSLYDNESIHWEDIERRFPWKDFVVCTAQWVKLIYKYLKDVNIHREPSLMPPEETTKLPPSSQNFRPSRASTGQLRQSVDRFTNDGRGRFSQSSHRAIERTSTPISRHRAFDSDATSDLLAVIAAKSAPAKSHRQVFKTLEGPASSPIRPSRRRSRSSLSPKPPSTPSSSSDGGDIPPFQEEDTEVMDISPGLKRESRLTQGVRQSHEAFTEPVNEQLDSKAEQEDKAPTKRYAIVPTLSKLLFALKPTGKGSRAAEPTGSPPSNQKSSSVPQGEVQRSIPWTEDQESESDRPPFVAKGRKVRELANVVSEESAQPDENNFHRKRFNDRQVGAHKVSPVDSQRMINVARDTKHAQDIEAVSKPMAKRRRDDVSDEESEGAFSSPRPYKRSRLTAMSHVEPAETNEDTTIASPPASSSESDETGPPPKPRSRKKSRADKPAPSRPLARSGVRKPWTEQECLALLEGVSIFGSSWSKIKSRDSELSEPKLSSRSQMNLKDKARQLAFDYYRARKAIPPGFEHVPLQTVKIQELEELGIEVARGSWGRRRTPPQ